MMIRTDGRSLTRFPCDDECFLLCSSTRGKASGRPHATDLNSCVSWHVYTTVLCSRRPFTVSPIVREILMLSIQTSLFYCPAVDRSIYRYRSIY